MCQRREANEVTRSKWKHGRDETRGVHEQTWDGASEVLERAVAAGDGPGSPARIIRLAQAWKDPARLHSLHWRRGALARRTKLLHCWTAGLLILVLVDRTR